MNDEKYKRSCIHKKKIMGSHWISGQNSVAFTYISTETLILQHRFDFIAGSPMEKHLSPYRIFILMRLSLP